MLGGVIIDIHAHPVSRDLVCDERNRSLMLRPAACLADTDAAALLLDRMERIVAAHLGVPWCLETVAVAVRHSNVYLDISACRRLSPEPSQPPATVRYGRGQISV